MLPIIEELYDKKEDQAKALKTYTAFFNTEPQLGTVIVGVTAGLEEARANGAQDVDDETINGLRVGLLDSPSSGQYLLDGKDVSSCSESKRNELRKGMLGFVFQSFNLIDELTVQENIALPLLYMGVPKQERQRRVEEAMARMDIMHRSRHYPRQISGGQQQRTAIARAIVTRPKLILADEPTGNLDSKNGKEVMGLLSELHREGTTIVMVTHSQHDAGYADRIIHLFDGHVLGEEEAGLQNL